MICDRDKKSLRQLAHWNYYLAIEQDLISLSRFIQFSEDNYETYSIELTRLLMTSTSEVDVLLKEICHTDKKKEAMSINDYRKFFQSAEVWDVVTKGFIHEVISMPRYNLFFTPWDVWHKGGKKSPEWWMANNKVKHHRSTDFYKANLSNVLNSIAALLHVNVHIIQTSNSQLFGSRHIEKPKLFETQFDPFMSWEVYR